MKANELFEQIHSGQIKENTKISVIDGLTGDYITEIEYKNKKLNWKSGEFDTSFLCDIDIVFETIEEKTEEISELRIAGIIVEEMENKNALRETLNKTFYDILSKTNEIILAVNRINKEREEK